MQEGNQAQRQQEHSVLQMSLLGLWTDMLPTFTKLFLNVVQFTQVAVDEAYHTAEMCHLSHSLAT